MTEPIPAQPASPPAPNRLPLILAIALATVLVLFVASKLLSDDDSGGTATTTSAPGASRVARATTTTSTTELVESFEVFTTKNPFQPLQGAVGATSGASTSTGGASSTGGTSGTSGTSGTAGSTGSAATAPRTTQRITLLDVFTEAGRTAANVRVNDTVYKVTAGETFATSYKAVSISGSSACGQFLFGDEPFQLCEGQETLK
jgi:hypothetical protein